MVKRKSVNWNRIRHAYITGSCSYAEIAKKFDVSNDTVEKEGKKGKWVEERRKYRGKVAEAAIARAQEQEVDKLECIRAASDRLAEQLEEITRNEKQLRMHTGIIKREDGSEELTERELFSVNTRSVRDLVASMKDLTTVLRNLHSISTAAKENADRIAIERIEIEKARLELEKERVAIERAKQETTAESAREIEIVYAECDMDI